MRDMKKWKEDAEYTKDHSERSRRILKLIQTIEDQQDVILDYKKLAKEQVEEIERLKERSKQLDEFRKHKYWNIRHHNKIEMFSDFDSAWNEYKKQCELGNNVTLEKGKEPIEFE